MNEKFICQLTRKKESLVLDNEEIFLKDQYKDIELFILGELRNQEIREVINLYLSEGISVLNRFNGSYTLILIDKKEDVVHVTQDAHLAFGHLYYHQTDEGVYLSNSLRKLYEYANYEPKLNLNALPTYLHYSFVPNHQTLMENVYKIISNQILSIYSNGRVEKRFNNAKIRMNHECIGKSPTLIFDNILSEIIENNQNKQIGINLSGGYDSNFLLSRYLKKNPDKEIMVYSYGSESQNSELMNAKNIVRNYKENGYKLKHRVHIASSDDLNYLNIAHGKSHMCVD